MTDNPYRTPLVQDQLPEPPTSPLIPAIFWRLFDVVLYTVAGLFFILVGILVWDALRASVRAGG